MEDTQTKSWRWTLRDERVFRNGTKRKCQVILVYYTKQCGFMSKCNDRNCLSGRVFRAGFGLDASRNALDNSSTANDRYLRKVSTN